MTEVNEVFDVVDGAVVLRVHAQPGAGRSAVVGRYGDAVKIRVAAPPDEGRANAALAELLARELGLKPADVALLAGDKGRTKRFRLGGLDPDDAEDAIERMFAQADRGTGPTKGRR
jgi:uncharacterized protein (TIGR00251 family)